MAGLVGGLLASKDFVESKGVRGVALALKPAIKTKRHVFVTPAFMRRHAQLCTEFSSILQLQDCNFQLLNRASLQDDWQTECQQSPAIVDSEIRCRRRSLS